MIVNRKKLSFWERLYLPAILGGIKVTARHFGRTLFKGKTAAKDLSGGFYPEKKWIKPVGYSLIGLTGFAMMNNKVHWAGDYPLAIALGYVAGCITVNRHLHHKKSILNFLN